MVTLIVFILTVRDSSGLSVHRIDVCIHIFVPLLGDMGADVIKVERPHGQLLSTNNDVQLIIYVMVINRMDGAVVINP